MEDFPMEKSHRPKHIAVLHECFFEQKHIQRLKEHGTISVYAQTKSEKKAINRLRGVDIAIIHCSLLPITSKILEQAKDLKFISLVSTGYDRVDIKSAKARGILISNLPSYGTESVAELTIALMLAVLRKIVVLDHLVRERPLEINAIDNIAQSPLVGENLRGKTLGIIGLGRIGSRVAEIGKAFGMKVIACDIVSKAMKDVKMVSINKLLQNSDIVTIHTPLTDQTEGMIDEKALTLMKRTAILINTARGEIVQTKALAKSLKNKIIAGAGIDTLTELNLSNSLLTLENVVLTPHSGWYSRESFINIANGVVANVESYINGTPINVIT